MTCEGRNLPRQLIARKLISSIAAQAFVLVSRAGKRQPTGKLTNARVNDHIHADGLICHYCERLRRGADMAATAVLAIQNVISWRQSERDNFHSRPLSHARFLFLLLTQA